MSTTESCDNAAELDVQVQKSPDGVLQAVLKTFNETDVLFTWDNNTGWELEEPNVILKNAIPRKDQWLFPEQSECKYTKYKNNRNESVEGCRWIRPDSVGQMPFKDLPPASQQRLTEKYKQWCTNNNTPIGELSSVKLTEWNTEFRPGQRRLGTEWGKHRDYKTARNQKVILTLYEGSPTVPSDQTECDGAEVESTAVSAPGDAVSSDSPGQHGLESIQTEELSVASNEQAT